MLCLSRRKAKKDAYLDGRARNPHKHTPILKRSLAEAGKISNTIESPSASVLSSTKICLQCKPVLSRYTEAFKSMVHKGSELKCKKAINPYPSKPDSIHYKDVVNQNEWLRQNMFDTLGNYLYCHECIRSAFGISKDRLTRQRGIKRLQLQQPLIEMTKSEVESKGLGSHLTLC